MDKQAFRVYRRCTTYPGGKKWALRAIFVSREDAEAYMRNKLDAIPCDIISIEWKIMQGNRNIRKST